MDHRSFDAAAAKLAAWQIAQAELAALENELVAAMAEYAKTLGEPPRQLVIQAERQREEVRGLFDVAMEALDAHSTARTGQTNFGDLS
ncbi:MAG: hypothetical protein HYX47_12070 [Burkholderiales bacterium]|nr:hypothetical protein [Burkholderiales bacterium]